jgi:hypothetical protein
VQSLHVVSHKLTLAFLPLSFLPVGSKTMIVQIYQSSDRSSVGGTDERAWHAGTQKSPIRSSFDLSMRFLGVSMTDRLHSPGTSDIRAEEDSMSADYIPQDEELGDALDHKHQTSGFRNHCGH